MNLSNINIVTPKKALLATMLTASLVAGASALNKQSDNISVEKQRTEFVNNRSYKDQFISVVSTVDEYDSRMEIVIPKDKHIQTIPEIFSTVVDNLEV